MTRHEIPTHLEAPDRFALGLTTKQAMQLVASASGAYGLMHLDWLPWETRAVVAALALVLGVLVALLRPGDRAMEEWILLLAVHVATPSRMVWRPCAAPADLDPVVWVALVPRVDWRLSRGPEGGNPGAR